MQFSDSDLEQGGPAGATGTQGKPGKSRHARYAPDDPLKLTFIRLYETILIMINLAILIIP